MALRAGGQFLEHLLYANDNVDGQHWKHSVRVGILQNETAQVVVQLLFGRVGRERHLLFGHLLFALAEFRRCVRHARECVLSVFHLLQWCVQFFVGMVCGCVHGGTIHSGFVSAEEANDVHGATGKNGAVRTDVAGHRSECTADIFGRHCAHGATECDDVRGTARF